MARNTACLSFSVYSRRAAIIPNLVPIPIPITVSAHLRNCPHDQCSDHHRVHQEPATAAVTAIERPICRRRHVRMVAAGTFSYNFRAHRSDLGWIYHSSLRCNPQSVHDFRISWWIFHGCPGGADPVSDLDILVCSSAAPA